MYHWHRGVESREFSFVGVQICNQVLQRNCRATEHLFSGLAILQPLCLTLRSFIDELLTSVYIYCVKVFYTDPNMVLQN